MAWRTWAGGLAAVVLGTAVGCGPAKLNQEKSFSMGSENGAVAYDCPVQSAAQTITVEVTADNAVDIYVLTGLSADQAASEFEGVLKEKAVASKKEVTQHTLTANIPAGQKPAVVVRLGDKTLKATGKVKMKN